MFWCFGFGFVSVFRKQRFFLGVRTVGIDIQNSAKRNHNSSKKLESTTSGILNPLKGNPESKTQDLEATASNLFLCLFLNIISSFDWQLFLLILGVQHGRLLS